MPRKWTFEIPYINGYLEKLCQYKRCLFPFAGMTRLRSPALALYIDIDSEVKPDIVGSCIDILPKLIKNRELYDVIILDPPFSAHAATKIYGTKKLSDIRIVKDYCIDLITPKGIVITFAFNSTGMGKNRGFIKDELHIFNHGGNHHDMMMLKEHMKNSLEKYL